MGDISNQQKREAERTREQFDDVWREIGKHSDEHWRVDLAIAANILGFCLYPVGWTWGEFSVRNAASKIPYRKKAQQVGKLGAVPVDHNNKAGDRAFATGVKFRQKRISDKLLRIIIRGEIPVFVTDEHMRTTPIGDEIRLFYDLNIDVKRNVIGFHDLKSDLCWTAQIDASKLILGLEKNRVWAKKSSINNWLRIEKIAREIIEFTGLPQTQEQLHTSLSAMLAETYPDLHEPNKSEVMLMLSLLFEEYSESENEFD